MNISTSGSSFGRGIQRIKGWDFSREHIAKAFQSGKMLMLDAEVPDICNLKCYYCYRFTQDKSERRKNEMNLDERKSLVDDAKLLGCQTIKIVGTGEPLCRGTDFWEQADYIVKAGMQLIVFTNGLLLGKDEAKEFNSMGASVIIKLNSMDSDTQDRISGKTGYAQKRDAAIEYLMAEGFNRTRPTRLGIDSVVTWENKDEVLEIFRWARNNNIFPVIKSFIPTGKAAKYYFRQVSHEELKREFGKAREFDARHGIVHCRTNCNYMGGFPCEQLLYALYVDIEGNIKYCPGDEGSIGGIRESEKALEKAWEKSLKERKKLHMMNRTCERGCWVRERFARLIDEGKAS